MEAVQVSVIDVHAAIAGPFICLKALQRGPDGYIGVFVLVDIPHSCHGKAEATLGEPRVPTQCVRQGEGSILQSEPTGQFPRQMCRATIPGLRRGHAPSSVPLSSRHLRLRKDKGTEPVV